MEHPNDFNHERGPDDEGCHPNQSVDYNVLYAVAGLNFTSLRLSDPVPLGRQFLERAGVRNLDNWALVAILPSGDFEEIRLDEPYDIRGRGAERLIGFETDRLFRFVLAGNQLLWGVSTIRGADLYALAEVDEKHGVFLDVPGGTDRLIKRDEVVNLSASGVERFIVAPLPASDVFEITIIYNGLPRALGVRTSETTHQVVEAARPLFGSPQGDLVLVNLQGAELPDGATMRDLGVVRGTQLLLRPRTVRGG